MEKTKVNVFFAIEAIVHIEVEAENPKDIDSQAWVKLGNVITALPDDVAVGEAKVKFVSPATTEKEGLLEEASDKEVPVASPYL